MTEDPEAHYTAVYKLFKAKWYAERHTEAELMGHLDNLKSTIGESGTEAEIDLEYIIHGGMFDGKHLLLALLVDYNLGHDEYNQMRPNFSVDPDSMVALIVNHYQFITMGVKIYQQIHGEGDRAIEAPAVEAAEPAPAVEADGRYRP